MRQSTPPKEKKLWRGRNHESTSPKRNIWRSNACLRSVTNTLTAGFSRWPGRVDQHGEICVNLIRELGSQLKGKPCHLRAQNTKVRRGPEPKPSQNPEGFYSYLLKTIFRSNSFQNFLSKITFAPINK